MPLLEKVEALHKRFGGRLEAVDRWLASRKDLLVLYCKLGLVPSKKAALPQAELVAELCNSLVDYVSAGHFEIYEQLLAEAEQAAPERKALAKKLYPRIAQTTDALLQFSDRYSDADAMLTADFDSDLATMGEALELRLELEDALIQALLSEPAVAV